MLKFTGEGERGTVYFLGLTRESFDRLVAGEPIPINLADLGGPRIDLCILFGETQRALFDQLKEGGLIPAEVEFREPQVGTAEVTRIIRERGKTS